MLGVSKTPYRAHFSLPLSGGSRVETACRRQHVVSRLLDILGNLHRQIVKKVSLNVTRHRDLRKPRAIVRRTGGQRSNGDFGFSDRRAGRPGPSERTLFLANRCRWRGRWIKGGVGEAQEGGRRNQPCVGRERGAPGVVMQ